jgi:hypothetical protein
MDILLEITEAEVEAVLPGRVEREEERIVVATAYRAQALPEAEPPIPGEEEEEGIRVHRVGMGELEVVGSSS